MTNFGHRYEITAEDILRSIEFGRTTSGTVKDKSVLDLIVSKFKLFKENNSIELYTFEHGKMGVYFEKNGRIDVFEVFKNNVWYARLIAADFYSLYGQYIRKVTPPNPDEIETDETDALTRVIDSAKLSDDTFFDVPIKAIANEAERLAAKTSQN